MINEETKPEETPIPIEIDPTTLALFDLEVRIITASENLITAEQLLNQMRDVSKVRKLKREDVYQFESLLIVTKEYFEVAVFDLMDNLFKSLGGKNGYEIEEIESLHD